MASIHDRPAKAALGLKGRADRQRLQNCYIADTTEYAKTHFGRNKQVEENLRKNPSSNEDGNKRQREQT